MPIAFPTKPGIIADLLAADSDLTTTRALADIAEGRGAR